MNLFVFFAIMAKLANLAHLVEQRTRNAQVFGSSPEVGFNLSVSFGETLFLFVSVLVAADLNRAAQ